LVGRSTESTLAGEVRLRLLLGRPRMSDDLTPLKRPTAREIWIFFSVLFALLLIAPLVVYVVLDQRGKNAWATYMRDAKARGEWTDADDLIPPPVPAAENFGAAPMFAPLFACTVKIEGSRREVVWLDQPGIDRLMSINPCPKDKAPGLDSWIYGTPVDFGKWQTYFGECRDRKGNRSFPRPEMGKSPAENVLIALGKFDKAYDELRVAAKRPLSRFPVQYTRPVVRYRHLDVLTRFGKIASLRALAELSLGRVDDAYADTSLALRMAESIDRDPLNLSLFVKDSLLRLTLQALWEGLKRRQWDEVQLRSFDSRLKRFNFAADCARLIEAEREFDVFPMLDEFRENRLQLASDMSESPVPSPFYKIWANSLPDGWFDGLKVNVERSSKHTLAAADPQAVRFYPDRFKIARSEWSKVLRDQRILPADTFSFSDEVLTTSMHSASATQGVVHLARLAIGLELFCLKHGGAYPETLAEISEVEPSGFILPVDPVTGRPAHYRLESHDGYVLYYDGWNQVDDGGNAAWRDPKQMSVDWQNGDWVWPKMRWK